MVLPSTLTAHQSTPLRRLLTSLRRLPIPLQHLPIPLQRRPIPLQARRLPTARRHLLTALQHRLIILQHRLTSRRTSRHTSLLTIRTVQRAVISNRTAAFSPATSQPSRQTPRYVTDTLRNRLTLKNNNSLSRVWSVTDSKTTAALVMKNQLKSTNLQSTIQRRRRTRRPMKNPAAMKNHRTHPSSIPNRPRIRRLPTTTNPIRPPPTSKKLRTRLPHTPNPLRRPTTANLLLIPRQITANLPNTHQRITRNLPVTHRQITANLRLIRQLLTPKPLTRLLLTKIPTMPIHRTAKRLRTPRRLTRHRPRVPTRGKCPRLPPSDPAQHPPMTKRAKSTKRTLNTSAAPTSPNSRTFSTKC